MVKDKKKRKRTIFIRILTPMLLVVVAQLAIYLFVLYAGGIFNTVKIDTLYNFNEKVKNRSEYISTDMINRWSNIESIRSEVITNIDSYLLDNGYTVEDIKNNPKLNERLVEKVSGSILKLLRNSGATGAFIVLDGLGVQSNVHSYSGMYIRDHDPSSQSVDNSDVLLECGMSSLSQKMGISLDSFWSAVYNFESETSENSQFFFKPMNAAKDEALKNSNQKFDYWSHNFVLTEKPDIEIITYSIPLINSHGDIYGVIGTELSTSYLAKMLPYSEIGHEKGGLYVLGITTDGGKTVTPIVKSGLSYGRFFDKDNLITTSDTDFSNITMVDKEDIPSHFVSQNNMKLYNSNTIFSNEEWVLMGMVQERDMFSFFTLFSTQIGIATLFSLFMGIIVVFIVGVRTTSPVTNLVLELKNSNPNNHISLSKINVLEIDSLSEAIEDLSLLVAQSASRISKIIDLSGFPVGVFEYNTAENSVFCSSTFLKFMDHKSELSEYEYIPKEEFTQMLDSLQPYIYDREDKIYKVNNDKWLQLKVFTEGDKTVGTMIDITRDMQEKQQIEYERDYDVLTNLYNRRAFRAKAEKLFDHNSNVDLKIGAMVMLDLDNLKYTNDQFGHDMGDKYIQALAKSLHPLIGPNSIVARRSGDEFYIFIYGYDQQSKIWDILLEFWQNLDKETIVLPNQDLLKVRASGGVAWYPADSDDLDGLLRLSDFAMYTAKNTLKGSLQQFNEESYKSDAVLYSGQEALNQLIEKEQVLYAMQPIVEVKTATIYGYEMLMRPQSKLLPTVNDVLRVARANSKNNQIERLTWLTSLKTFANHITAGTVSSNAKVFINSVANNILAEKSILEIERQYGNILSRVVLEITEEEKEHPAYTAEKQNVLKRWGGLLAIDDFGSGYNGDNMLLSFLPDILKTDMDLVRDIDKDINRQVLMQNIINYSKERNFSILAEGVETEAEMRMLVDMGVDYLQGYYFSKPTLEVPTVPENSIATLKDAYEKSV